MILICLWLLVLLVCPLLFDIRRIILHLPPIDFWGNEEQDFTVGERMGVACVVCAVSGVLDWREEKPPGELR